VSTDFDMIPVIEEQDGINGKWQIARGLQKPKELKFDRKEVHETLKRDRKRRTVKVQQPELL